MLIGISLLNTGVVTTTRPMSNNSTACKSQSGYLVETQVVYLQENSIGNHNSILPIIYIKSPWFIL